MIKNQDLPGENVSPVDRRKFLARNFAAIGSLALSLSGCNALGGGVTRASDGSNGVTPRRGGSDTPNCFLKGTRIRTVDGDRPVEELKAGDLLVSVFGGVRPVLWVGREAFRKSDPAKPWVRGVMPIRVAKSAISPNVPMADLYLSCGHHVYIDGVLTPVGHLANGATIDVYRAEEFDELEYFHIKLESHDVIIAEGAPCESLRSVTENAANFAEYYRAYGAPAADEAPCAPIERYEGRTGMIASRLRSAASPWLDRRAKIDLIRDRLEERAAALTETV